MRGKRKRQRFDEAAIGAYDWFAIRAKAARRRVTEETSVTDGAGQPVVTARWAFVAQLMLEARGFVTFLPAKGVHRFANHFAVARKAKDLRPAPIYPGWVFVGIEPGANRWRELAETPAVLGVLGDDGRPWRIPTASMVKMFQEHGGRLKAEDRERFMPSRREYAPGDLARVTGGPFEGTQVKVIEVRGRQARVLLKLFGGETTTTVDPMLLEAA